MGDVEGSEGAIEPQDGGEGVGAVVADVVAREVELVEGVWERAWRAELFLNQGVGERDCAARLDAVASQPQHTQSLAL